MTQLALTVKDWTVTWFKAARAPFLIVSAVPTCLGGAIAYSAEGRLEPTLFLMVLAGVLLAQTAADFVDDYFDFYSGNLGNKDKQFHDSPLLDGKITPGQVLSASLISAAAAALVGVYLTVRLGAPVLYLAAIGGFVVVFYTAPPLRLNYRGFGELALFLGFGPALVLGVVYVLTGELGLEPALAAVPLGLLTMNVGHVSNIFDIPSDLSAGKNTLAVRLGPRRAVLLLALFTALTYLTVILGALLELLPLTTLLVLLTLPLAVQVVRAAARYEDKMSYPKAMGRAIALTTTTGLILSLAYLIGR